MMKILVIGGTRFFGIHMVKQLLEDGHEVTIATRGIAQDDFGNSVKRILLERTDIDSMRNALKGTHFDVAIDKIAYCSNDIKSAMETVNCDKYIHMSSTAIYQPKHIDTREEEFDGMAGELVWCSRKDFSYEEIKRQAERALWQKYNDKSWVAVRYPFVIGRDDYTERLLFYVQHVMKSIPMNIDNLDHQIGFIRSDEAGKFLAFLADKDFTGAINGSSQGTVSLKDVISYVETKTGVKAIVDSAGDDAPYNGESEYSINTEKAQKLGFQFSQINDWIYDLLDYYIDLVK